MSKYKYLIFDVDDTILDFYPAFLTAQKNVAKELGIEYSEEYLKTDEEFGWKAWNEMRLDQTDDEEIQRNYHEYYYEYLRRHYVYLLEKYGMNLDVKEVVKVYLDSLASSAVLKEDCALDVIHRLSENAKIIFATNGTVDVQKKRVVTFSPYLHRIYISEAMGVIKPTRDFYEYILKDLNCTPDQCLMIGDSVTNDVIGAKNVGMDACYYNPKHKEINKDVRCDYIISSLKELEKLML